MTRTVEELAMGAVIAHLTGRELVITKTEAAIVERGHQSMAVRACGDVHSDFEWALHRAGMPGGVTNLRMAVVAAPGEPGHLDPKGVG